MIFNAQFFNPTVPCYFNGAISEEIVLAGTASYSFNTNSTGTTGVQYIIPGIYSVTGKISGYTININVTTGDTYNVYPSGAIYWYGKEFEPFSLARHGSTVGELTKLTNCMQLFYNGADTGSTQRAAAALTTNSVNMENYTTLNFITNTITQGSNCYSGVFKTSSITYSAFQNSTLFSAKSSLLNNTGKMQYSVNISSVSSGYIGTGIAEYNAHNRYVQIDAIWME